MSRFEGKTVVVTGGTSGIGEATAILFAEEGANVFIAGRSYDRGKEIVESLRNDGYDIEFVTCEMSQETDVKWLIERAVGRTGGIDVLVNNAAMFYTCPLEDQSTEKWDNMFDVNVKGYFWTTKYALPFLKQSKGCIINNASVAGMHSYVSGKSFAYSASKAAVIQFSRVCALNYASDGVRVNAICPGIIQTPVYNKDVSDSAYKIPLLRVGRSEEVANVIAFLASKEASYLTGIVLPVDGGLTL